MKTLLLLAALACAQDLRQLHRQANALSDRGDLQGAARLYEQGLSLARRGGHHEAVANFARNLGFVYADLGEYAKAREALEEAAEVFGSLNLPKGRAGALSSLGRIKALLGRYEEALADLSAARAVHEQLGDRLGVSICLRETGSVHAARGEHKTALAFYERSYALAREVDDERGQGADLANLSIAHKNMGDLGAALAHAEKALALDERLGDALAVAQDHAALGNIHAEAGRLDRALSSHEKALAYFKKAGAGDGEADALINLAVARSARGEFEAAFALLEQALAVKKELGARKGEATALLNLSVVAAESGDLALALRRAQESLSIARELGDHDGTLEALQALGGTRRALGGYREAEEALSEALALARRGSDLGGEGRALGGLASLYIEVGDWDKAFARFEEALAVQRRAQARADEATTLNNLAVALRARGEDARAQETLKASLALSRELGIPSKEQELGLADLALSRGELEAARAEYERLDAPIALGRLYLKKRDPKKALEAFARSARQTEAQPDPLAAFAEAVGEGQARLLLGEAAQAGAAFARAADLAEAQREGLDEAARTGFFEGDVLGFRRAEAYEGLIAAAAAAGDADSAFQRAESLKARTLSEAIARAGLARAAALPPALREEEERLEAETRLLRREADAQLAAGEREPKKQELSALAERRERFVSRLRAEHSQYAALRYPRPLKAAELGLVPGETLLEFAFTGEKVLRFAVSGGKASMAELPVSAAALKALVSEYRAGFMGVASASDLAALDLDAGRRLYDLLVRGAAPAGTRLIVVPDGVLGLLPFEALVASAPAKAAFGEGEHGPFPLGVRYLGDEREVSYAQSATALTLLRARPAGAASGALAVVDPAFGAAEPALAAWTTMGVSGARAKGAKRESLFPRLEKTRALGELFARLFPGAVVLSGEKADKRELSKVDLKGVRWAAFGTHGLLGSEVPYLREPALLLSGGYLTMSEVLALDLPAEAVALTACQTGVGRSVGGEGVMGMGRAFQHAGASSVLMSLWPVAEDGSVALTSAFFEALGAGEEPRAALRKARSAVRRAGYEHPFYWAAFILVSR